VAIEIERKFLVRDDTWRCDVIAKARLKQAYLANQANASVRVRVGEGRAYLNIKGFTLGVTRSEFEYEIPLSDAELMLEQVTIRPCIDKTRYKVRHADHVWDLDVFHGENEGLVVAEIELAAADELFTKPDWAGDEVSTDPRYYNVNLVEHPYKAW
jgi:adenylate cyclase